MSYIEHRRLVVILFFITLPLSATVPLWVTIPAVALLLWEFFRPFCLPAKLRFTIFPMFAIILFHFRTLFDPEAAASLLLFLNVLKIIEIKKVRDYMACIFISFFLIAAQALFSQTIGSTLYFIACFIFVLGMWPRLYHPRTYENKPFLTSLFSSVFEFAMVVPIVAVLFFFFPRFNARLLPLGKNKVNLVGFNKNVFNNQGNLQLSDGVAFRAKMNQDVPSQRLYWRGTTLWFTNGFNWYYRIPKQIREKRIKLEESFSYEVILQDAPYGILFVVDNPINVIDSNKNVLRGENKTYFLRYEKQKNVIYKATSTFNEYKKEDPYTKKHLLTGVLSKQTIKLAKSMSENPSDFVEDMKKYLLSNGFRYTISPGNYKNLDQFLERKLGFCTHFASAMAIFARVNGIPSRLVSGYQGGSYNPYGDFITVKENDAHSWVELYDKNMGWFRVDPTYWISPTRFEIGGDEYLTTNEETSAFRGAMNSVFKGTSIYQNYLKLSQYFDSLNFQWVSFLESFDKDSQSKLAYKLKLQKYQFFLMAFFIPLALINLWFVYGWFVRNMKRREEDEMLVLYNKFRKKSEKMGIIIQSNEAADIALKKWMGKNPEVEKFLSSYIEARYSKGSSFKELKNLLNF
jgi:hypothetical protein